MENTAPTEPDFSGITLEKILAPGNLLAALERVEANKGAPGIDGMQTHELRDYIKAHPGEFTRAVRTGTYRPSPVKRVSIPKPEKGKYRDLGIPTVLDRLLQQAVAQVMGMYYDVTFSASSYGFRPFRGAKDAIMKVIGHTDDGYVWAVDMDLEKFFDTVDQSRLIRKLSTRIKDARVISLIHRMLTAGVMVDGKVIASNCGLMQGGPLSPLLANIYLDELDKELEKRGHRFARYADDLMILCRSKRAAQRTLQNLTKLIEGRMHLKVNQAKSTVAHITRGVKFLSFGFWVQPKTRRIVPGVHAKAKQRFMDSIRQILTRNQGCELDRIKDKLREKLTGWNAYFRPANYKGWLQETDKWIRRRIRMLIWKRWKLIKTRQRALVRLGVKHEQAYKWANTRKSYWRIAGSHVLKVSLNNARLKSHGWNWLAMSYQPMEWR